MPVERALSAAVERREILNSEKTPDRHLDKPNVMTQTAAQTAQTAPQTIDLAGTWQFALDPADSGRSSGQPSIAFTDTVRLPGSLQEQGLGFDVTLDAPWTGSILDRNFFEHPRYEPYRQPGALKVPFWLQPDKVYVGPAWYQRTVEIPPAWVNRRVVLTLERPHWETHLWLDGEDRGSERSLSTPHVYDLGRLTPGHHTLTLRVDNRMVVDVGANAHSVTDHTQTNWNGVVGRLTLAATDLVWIENVQVFPHAARKTALVRVQVGNATGRPVTGALRLAAASDNGPQAHQAPAHTASFALPPAGGWATIPYPLGDDALLWDEFSPALYRLDVTLDAQAGDSAYAAQAATTFGLRDVGVRGTQITLNGRPFFVRGTLECCVFPRTGYPSTDVDEWKRIIRIAQAHGLNHFRFHSWCPPEAAFIAGDELGFTFQVETAAWANFTACIGEGDPLDSWLYDEAERIVAAYGNHPSWIMFAYGNEPSGRLAEYLGQWVSYWKGRDARRLHTSGAGWPAIAENDYHNIFEPRTHWWGEGLASRLNAVRPETASDYRAYTQPGGEPRMSRESGGAGGALLHKPIVSHEIGQWCVYPNFAEMPKYTGVLKPKNFEIFHDFLAQNGMAGQAHDFLMASGKLQAICYKEEIESALRTPGFGGFHLLDLHDFPGQGTALVGVLDPFWEEKGYIRPEEFRRFCGPTTPLARLATRLWRGGDTFAAAIEVAHFGPHDLADAVVEWTLRSPAGVELAHGSFGPLEIPTGSLTAVGELAVPLADSSDAEMLLLEVRIPAAVETAAPAGVRETSALDESALAHLAGGGALLLMLPPDKVRADAAVGFTPAFWNTAWTNNQTPHTLGLLVDPAHPLFAAFPTGFHADWQWWEPLHGAAAMTLDGLPPTLRPLVQPIDTWFEARRLGLLFEARLNGGKLMVCSMDLRNHLEDRPAARQLRHSLLRYLAGSAFDPQVEVSAEAIAALLLP